MTMLKDDLIAQHYCRQLSEIMAATKINKLLSLQISDWCIQLKNGIQVGIKETKGTTPEIIKVDLRIEDLELFIKELQEALTIFSTKEKHEGPNDVSKLLENELKSRKELQTAFGGVSASTIDRFFKHLVDNRISFHKEALHGRSDVYLAGQMKALYVDYQNIIKNKPK